MSKEIDKKDKSAISVRSSDPPIKRRIPGTDSAPRGRSIGNSRARDVVDKRIGKIDNTKPDPENESE